MESRVKLLKALSDESRMRIVRLLMGGEQCACSIVPYVKKAQPTVSRHLKILEEAGVVQSRRDGTNIWYHLKGKDATKVLGALGIRKIRPNAKC
ncbi:MAG: winged helix-turn-helix transcriptional regulator [Candidatus Diapherotrites archaeon]|uniref:Winged helix-turn-helix transcriptional regulator n=1 Tax=Candidatus Iainarchaeum sp. TaxID=3101447 RepID=A0A8T3YJB9_9ARCH|nr:winged helix-turn-helix transcriptional regulator [Candidatus Diapherotrites archaeon]